MPIAVSILALAACKTTEKNYRTAYEKAIDRDSDDPIENTIFAAIRNEAIPSAAITATGDTIPFKYERLTVTDGQGSPEQMHRYNVVAGQFKQAFNSRAMASRLREHGYPDTFIIQTAEPLYYVIVFSSDDPTEANAAMTRLRSDSTVTLPSPAPFIIAPTD